jgi:predicted nucleic acid-binding Zn ribbon protein
VPEAPWRDASVTATCPVCDSPLPQGRARSWCSPRCRQAAYRARHRPPTTTLTLPTPATRSRTAVGVYERPGCGDRLASERRCPACNLFARRLGDGGHCPACSEVITIQELLDIS